MRLQAMERDNWACFACGRWSEVTLNVHHKVYRGSKPWHAHVGDLQTLCEQCHENLGPHPDGGVWYVRDHNGKVSVYRQSSGELRSMEMTTENVIASIQRTRGRGSTEDARVLGEVVCKRIDFLRMHPGEAQV